jgi:circadian clock protein KaiC
MADSVAPERVTSGVPGLDEALGGGLVRGGMYLLQGPPGSGKTIIANQFCFTGSAAGHRSLFIALLAEPHDRLIQYLGSLRFFRPNDVGHGVAYVSGLQGLQEGKIEPLQDLLIASLNQYKPSLLVVDDIATAYALAGDAVRFRRFLHRLQAFTYASGTTTFVLAPDSALEVGPLAPVVDGVIEVEFVKRGLREGRTLTVRKSRGGKHLPGRHFFDITDDGVVVYPRSEAVRGLVRVPDVSTSQRMTTGVRRLDQMLSGGIVGGSVMLVEGPTGSGKTLLGLHFATGGDEPALYVAFYESPTELLQKAKRIGLDAEDRTRTGRLEILWQPPQEGFIDVLAARLLSTVDRAAARRVVIDGLGGFQALALYPERLARFLSAVMNELRSRGTAVLLTAEPPEVGILTTQTPVAGLSPVVDGVIVLRYTHIRGDLRRFLAILKVRESDYDKRIHEFDITDRGIVAAESPESAAAMLGDRRISPRQDADADDGPTT